jgi:NAD(P)-dependent dehydrogenase (short-subunit alcohol dehydrogenase family)
MVTPEHTRLFDLSGRVAVVTGGSGVLGRAMALGLARAGARVGVLGRRAAQAEAVAAEIDAAGGAGMALVADVLRREALEAARDAITERWAAPDILVNAAGGNVAGATLQAGGSFFEMPETALREVVDLNLFGTLLPSQVFGAAMGAGGAGAIVNVSSMAAQRTISRVVGYSAAKAAVENFTRWLAVELAMRYGAGVRVNALAPGFFVGEQNRRLLLNEDGSLTARGQAIIQHTPAGRFGEPDELVGPLVWLCSPAAAFVNGVVVPVDGGFSTASGV